MLEYQDDIVVTRLTGTSSDGMGGETGSSTTEVYSGRADVQDVGALYRVREGALLAEGDALCFLPDNVSDLGSMQAGDAVAATYGGHNGSGTESFTVAQVSVLDDHLVLQRV